MRNSQCALRINKMDLPAYDGTGQVHFLVKGLINMWGCNNWNWNNNWGWGSGWRCCWVCVCGRWQWVCCRA